MFAPVGLPGGMPTLSRVRPIHGGANRLVLRVNIAFCDVHIRCSDSTERLMKAAS